MWMLGTAALAQDQVVWDFDASVPAAGALAGELLFEVPASPWDRLALGVAPTAVSATDAFGWACLSLPSDGSVVVTHPRLTAWVSTDAPADTSMMLMVDDAVGRWVGDGGAVASAGSWTALEVSGLDAACGQSVGIDLAVSGAVPGVEGVGWIDDVTFTGEPCAAFVDGDGDGSCPLGHDVDGDGTCVADDERSPDVVDCDDGRFGPSCLTLAVDTSVDTVTVTVTGAPAGASVELWGSGRAGSTCPARFDGACLDLARAKPVVVLIAGADGVASGSLWVPALAPGRPVGLQAAVAGDGPADVSPVVAAGN